MLLRRFETSDQGTFGRLETEGFVCFTGELPWRDNAHNVSCIPAGRYRCVVTYSPHFKTDLYLVTSVPDRSGVRIHPANFMGDRQLGFRSQLNGCVALGERLGRLAGQKAVLVSRPAIRRFSELMRGRPFDLEVINEYS